MLISAGQPCAFGYRGETSLPYSAPEAIVFLAGPGGMRVMRFLNDFQASVFGVDVLANMVAEGRRLNHVAELIIDSGVPR